MNTHPLLTPDEKALLDILEPRRIAALRDAGFMLVRRETYETLMREPRDDVLERIPATCWLDAIAMASRINREILLSPARRREIAWPRQVAMDLIVAHSSLSLLSVGRMFHRDHTTVIHACRAVAKRIADGCEETIRLRKSACAFAPMVAARRLHSEMPDQRGVH